MMKDNFVSAASYIFGQNNDGIWFVLCGKRSGNNPQFSGGLMNVPVGMREPNESIVQCAQRECQEETRLNIPENLFKFVGSEKWASNKVGANFYVNIGNIGDYKPQKGDWENKKFFWLPISQIDEMNWAFGMNNTIKNIFKQNTNTMKKINENSLRRIIRNVLNENMNSNELIDTLDDAIKYISDWLSQDPKMEFELKPLSNLIRNARILASNKCLNKPLRESYWDGYDGWEEDEIDPLAQSDAQYDEMMDKFERNEPMEYYGIPEDEYYKGLNPPDDMYNNIYENRRKR